MCTKVPDILADIEPLEKTVLLYLLTGKIVSELTAERYWRQDHMDFKISKYEVKYFGKDDWKETSERIVLESITDSFGQVAPVICDLLQGIEIITPNGIFRRKD